MRIIDCEDRTDLRTIVAKHVFLKRVDKIYKLKNNEAVCFTNKALTRFRLVMKISNALFMCIPEIDEKSQYSVYLKISETLSKLAGVEQRVYFDFFKDYTKARIKRQKRRKKRRPAVKKKAAKKKAAKKKAAKKKAKRSKKAKRASRRIYVR